MSRTDQAIQHLADTFCQSRLSRDAYIKSMESLVSLARAEQILKMQFDFEDCMRVTLKGNPE
jgi:hypothetical protein